MRFGLGLALVVLASACTPAVPQARTSPSVPPAESTRPDYPPEPSFTEFPPTPAPTPEQTTQVPAITVAVNGAAIPIEPTLSLRSAPVDDVVTGSVRWGIERYLEMLDHFRETGATNRQALSVYGRFGDAEIGRASCRERVWMGVRAGT